MVPKVVETKKPIKVLHAVGVVAEPPCPPPPPSLTLTQRESRTRAKGSGVFAVGLPCPLPGVSAPLGGADALPCPSCRGNVTVAALVKPRAKRPPAAAGR